MQDLGYFKEFTLRKVDVGLLFFIEKNIDTIVFSYCKSLYKINKDVKFLRFNNSIVKQENKVISLNF